MNIAKQKLEVEVEGGKFIFLDADIETFSKIIEVRKAGEFSQLYQMTLDQLVGLENVFDGEKALSLEDFKASSVSSYAAILLSREYIEALNKKLLSEFQVEPEKIEKNVESPIALNGSFTDHA